MFCRTLAGLELGRIEAEILDGQESTPRYRLQALMLFLYEEHDAFNDDSGEPRELVGYHFTSRQASRNDIGSSGTRHRYRHRRQP